MRREHRDMLLAAPDPDALLDGFQTYEAPIVEKWIRRGER